MNVFFPDFGNGSPMDNFDELKSDRKPVKMASVPTGCFFKSLGKLYLKIAQKSDGLHFNNDREIWNCFCVADGYFDFLDLTMSVYPVDVEILISEAKGDN
jgi:hypothetical protein